MNLRPYQITALSQIRAEYIKGNKKLLLHCATGSGKTVIFCELLKSVHKKGKHALMVVRGRKLVDQASVRLFRENVDHGVMMANHWNYRPHCKIQICSIDTMRARKLKPKAELVIVDEAHHAVSDSYIEFLNQYDCFILGVTATPYSDKPLSHCANKIIKPISIQELIDLNFLVDARYFVPHVPDLKGVGINSGTKDYNQKQLSVKMGKLVGDLITHWKDFAKGRPTLCFAVSIMHSKKIVEEFNNQGISAVHCDASSTDEERNLAVEKLKNGEIYIVSNVGIFCTGVDIPFLSCILLARPTRSRILHIQQIGRGTRISKDKSDFIVLDHAGNVPRHGVITDELDGWLDGKTKIPPVINVKICRECFMAYTGTNCPNCGAVNKKPRKFETVDGELKELVHLTFDEQVKKFIQDKKLEAKNRNYKRGWVYYQLIDMYGEEIANEFMPKNMVPHWMRENC